MERLSDPGVQTESEALALTLLVRDLLELVAAIDRRVPRAERAGEVAIARDAARLKAKALRRVAELERERAATEAP